MSETKVQPTHLRRAAVVYVRQSTVAQVEQNRESTRRQYDLAERARQFGWRTQPAVITDALASRTQQRQNGDRQRADQQQTVPPVRARNMHRRESHPEAHVLDVPKARLNPPALAVVPNQDPRRDCRFAGHQAPRFVHLRILYAHDHADRQLVRVGHPSTHQPPRTPLVADPRGGRSPLAARIRHIDVSTQPNHVFEGQLRAPPPWPADPRGRRCPPRRRPRPPTASRPWPRWRDWCRARRPVSGRRRGHALRGHGGTRG